MRRKYASVVSYLFFLSLWLYMESCLVSLEGITLTLDGTHTYFFFASFKFIPVALQTYLIHLHVPLLLKHRFSF